VSRTPGDGLHVRRVQSGSSAHGSSRQHGGSFLQAARYISTRTVIEVVMPSQTVTRAAESDLEPGSIYTVLAHASNVPKWAPGFADAIERIEDARYRVTKNGQTFNVEVYLHPSAGTVDYVREMPNGKRGGAYLRVTPRPLGGSTTTITVPVGPTTSESEVAKVLEQELADIIQLARS
jgi:hypothetical protein